jgi:hypothetical protein
VAIRSNSNLVCLSAVLLGTAFTMLSCASSSHPDQLKVHVPEQFSGIIHVDTCAKGTPSGEEVTVDAKGLGKTSLCPAADHSVEIEVVRANREYKISSSEVQIQRTGDSIATSIEAHLPQ